jgi:UDP-N-acetylmuramoylalanine--D-glutamate ligase
LDDKSQADAEVFVVELSSFQLETLQAPFLDSAVLLNITPDHLDRYSSMEDYACAKLRIADLIKAHGKFFVENECFKQFSHLFKTNHLHRYGYTTQCDLYCDTKEVSLYGKLAFELPIELRGRISHDVENMMASFALCSEMGVSTEAFLAALKTFKKPAHRIEFIRDLSGVRFYDDSKGTNIDAVVRAVDYVEGQIILIVGGVDKGAPYTPWIDAFGTKVKSICAIGQSAEKIYSELNPYISVEKFTSLEDAVVHAASIAREGDAVLLSPGCSSFDMFKDYAHRGEEFQRIVNALYRPVYKEKKR